MGFIAHAFDCLRTPVKGSENDPPVVWLGGCAAALATEGLDEVHLHDKGRGAAARRTRRRTASATLARINVIDHANGMNALRVWPRLHSAVRLLAITVVLVATAFFSRAYAADAREDIGFGSNPGNLRMFSYIPDSLESGSPLIVVLHGCKQRAAAFARDAGWLDVANEARAVLLLPEQRGLPRIFHDVYVFPWLVALYGANNQNACFNWFEPRDTVRDSGEALSIRQMIDSMIARHALDPARLYVVGLSAGGAMTAAMLASYPELFAGGAIVAGVPFGCADNVAKALQCMNPGIDRTASEWRRLVPDGSVRDGKIPIIAIWHGDADERVAPRNRQELVEQWTAVHGLADKSPTRDEHAWIVRERYADDRGTTMVESVLVRGLGHAFPIRTDGAVRCGQPSAFVTTAGGCAAREIARFWGVLPRSGRSP